MEEERSVNKYSTPSNAFVLPDLLEILMLSAKISMNVLITHAVKALFALIPLVVTTADARKALRAILLLCARDYKAEYARRLILVNATPMFYVQMVTHVREAVVRTYAKKLNVDREQDVMVVNAYVHQDTKAILTILETDANLKDSVIQTRNAVILKFVSNLEKD